MGSRIGSQLADKWATARAAAGTLLTRSHRLYLIVVVLALVGQVAVSDWLVKPHVGISAWVIWVAAVVIALSPLLQNRYGLRAWFTLLVTAILLTLGHFTVAVIANLVIGLLTPPNPKARINHPGMYLVLRQSLFWCAAWAFLLLPPEPGSLIFMGVTVLGVRLLKYGWRSDWRILFDNGSLGLVDVLTGAVAIHSFHLLEWFHFLVLATTHVAYRVLLTQYVSTTEEARARWERELRLAKVVQSNLNGCIPVIQPGFEAFGATYPAADVGGDYVDVIPLDDHRIVMVLGDVMGKGLPAALLMVLLRGVVRHHLAHESRPGPLLTAVNSALYQDFSAVDSFATLGCALVDIRRGTVTFASAGQGPLTWVPPQGDAVEIVAKGPPLGLRLESVYTDVEWRVQTDDLLFMASDGVTDAPNRQGQRYGRARLRSVVTGSRLLPLLALPELIAQDVLHFADSQSRDDLSLASLRVRKIMHETAALGREQANG